MNSLREKYTQNQSAISTTLGLKNVMELPKLKKISVNIGMGELKGNDALQKQVAEILSIITGQKPVQTRAKRAIAGFKLRENDVIGYRVTLRGERMYDFLDRLVTYVFPRLRDFQGISSTGFDRHGNFTFGLREQTVFPEVPYQGAEKTWGMQITLVTSATDDAGARALLEAFGFPFTKSAAK
ncbi:MAG TPA: 50S ribosomal protein L5 [Patescibacteria group bacterium]